jgi:predicted enzyme related to lactoylglutathione lyase
MTDAFRSRVESCRGDTTMFAAGGDRPMTRQRLERMFGASDGVPTARTVPNLEVALSLVRRLGGSIVSEIRTAPGIGSWAFVADSEGGELVLWQSTATVRG